MGLLEKPTIKHWKTMLIVLLKTKIYIWIVCFFAALAQISPLCASQAHELKKKELSQELQQLFKTVPKLLDEKFQLQTIGKGHSFRKGRPKAMNFDFRFFRSVTKEEARQLLLDVSSEIVQYINKNQDLYPNVFAWGFDYKNVNIAIFIHPNGRYCCHPEMGMVGIENEKIRYKTYREDKHYLPKTKAYETYEEALALSTSSGTQIECQTLEEQKGALVTEDLELRVLESEIQPFVQVN